MGALYIRCRIIIRTQKGTLILTTTHIGVSEIPDFGLLITRILLFSVLDNISSYGVRVPWFRRLPYESKSYTLRLGLCLRNRRSEARDLQSNLI